MRIAVVVGKEKLGLPIFGVPPDSGNPALQVILGANQ
jgi:hypothetical protein